MSWRVLILTVSRVRACDPQAQGHMQLEEWVDAIEVCEPFTNRRLSAVSALVSMRAYDIV